MFTKQLAGWMVAGVLGIGCLAQQYRATEAERVARGYQEMAKRVEEHNRQCFERVFEHYRAK
jgi:Pyruvate/2-oxoacid:ferredoxin oxidoreductase gamma subunit